MLNNRFLHRILSYQLCPNKLFSCCKKYAVYRKYTFRWKNKIYFRVNRIKIVNCGRYLECTRGRYKEFWFKYGKIHRDDIDPVTGLTLPAIVDDVKTLRWYKDGKKHNVDIDPVTGLTLPYYINILETKEWAKNGQLHRDEFDPETGFTFPASVCKYYHINTWLKNGQYYYRDDIDPETGLILPDNVFHTGEDMYWNKNVVNIDPDTGLFYPNHISSCDVPENIFNKIYSLVEENE